MLGALHGAVPGCSFLVTNAAAARRTPEALRHANEFLQRRGPDATSQVERNGVLFVHNLLSLTGVRTTQPFVDEAHSTVALFNGEIYNWRELGVDGATTDGHVLLPMYRRYGEDFAARLNGEFAIVVADFARDRLMLSTDVFGTKPFYVASNGTEWGVASYYSALLRLGLTRCTKNAQPRQREDLRANAIQIRQLSTFKLLDSITLHSFDLRQHKTQLDDWNAALRVAMERRAGSLQHGVFMGLSSGADSGVIALELSRMRVPHHVYSVRATENVDVLRRRHAFLQETHCGCVVHPVITLARAEYEEALAWAARHVEAYSYTTRSRHGMLLRDPGAIAMSHICALSHQHGVRIYLSGAGADEVYHDYGRITSFPANLSTIYPWKTFRGLGEMRDYLRKEELIAGGHGIETRYPLLDVDLVQEFLWLDHAVKNRAPKHPLVAYMKGAGFPLQTKKVGFWDRAWEHWTGKTIKNKSLVSRAEVARWQCRTEDKVHLHR